MLLERYAYNIYGTFFPVFKHSGDWEISRKLCKPSTACRLYITFLDHLTSSRAQIRVCKKVRMKTDH